MTEKYYGKSGQESIDPVVFFKLCLVGYLENIISDRQLINHCSMRMDILYFLNYDIDEKLPWHSTVSRTRQLFSEEVFEEVFTRILAMCVEEAMVKQVKNIAKAITFSIEKCLYQLYKAILNYFHFELTTTKN